MSETYNTILVSVDARGLASIRLNRPEVHNAFNAVLISELQQAFEWAEQHPDVRVIQLSGEGKSFSAGADLNWMRDAAKASEEDNHLDALKMAEMFNALNDCPKPVIGLVQGAVMGGGVGLVAICDIVIAHKETQFSLSEVRLGLIPAVISPFVIGKIGESASRRYMISGERFDTFTAQRIGLIHEVSDDPSTYAKPIIDQLLTNGPMAMAHAKAFIWDVKRLEDPSFLNECTSKRIAKLRTSPEGREGIAAFLEKRPPNWVHP